MPTAQICTMTPVALMVGENRIFPGFGIIHHVGNANLDSETEKRLRMTIVEKALEALETELNQQKVFQSLNKAFY